MLVLMTVIWGGTFVVIKKGLADASPFLFLGLRFGLASGCGLVLWFPKLRGISSRTLVRGLLLGLFMFIGYGSQTFGLRFTTVAKSSLFTYTFALVTPALQYVVARKPLVVGNLVGLLVVFGGMYLFTAPEAGSLNIGDYATLAGAFVFAFYIVYLDRYSSEEDPAQLTLIQFFTTTLLALLCSFLFERPSVRWTANLFVGIAYLGVMGSVVAIYVMNRFQKDTTPTKAAVIYALEPVFTVLFGYLILREGLAPCQILGGLLILAGVVVSELWAIRRKAFPVKSFPP